MGILNPVCVATDGQYVYGLVYASNYSDPSSSYNILIKSNQYPTPTTNTWTLVSAVPRDGYFYLGEDNINGLGYSCAVDSTGIFTALAHSSAISKGAPADNVIRGLQYQPAGNVWKNVNTSPNYVWTDSNLAHLAYLKDPTTGAFTLMHASLSTKDPAKNVIAVAVLETNNLTMVQNPTPWELDATRSGVLKGITLMSNATMYAFGVNKTGLFDQTFLTIINLSSGSTALPPATSMSTFEAFLVLNSCTNYNNFNMMTLGSTLYVTCRSSTAGAASTYLGTFSGVKFDRQSVDGYFENVRSILPVNGAIIPYIFMHNSTGVYGVNVAGSKMGQWQGGSSRISISDSYGINPGPSSNSPTLDPTSDKGSGSSAGIIGGVCAALVLVAAVLFFVFYRRKRRHLQTKEDGKESTNINANVDANTNTSRAPMNQRYPTGPSHLEGKFDVGSIPVERQMKLDVTEPWSARPVPSYQDLYPHQQQPQSTLSSAPISQGATSGIYTSGVQYSPSLHVHAPHETLPVQTNMPHVSPAFTNMTLDTTDSRHSGQAVPTFWEPKPFVPPARTSPGQPPSSSTGPSPQIPSHSRPNHSGYGSP